MLRTRRHGLSLDNDGRIRVPVQGLTFVTEVLSSELKHELVHSFIRQKTLGPLPGMAERRAGAMVRGPANRFDTAAALVAAFGGGQHIALQRLEGPWTGMPGPAARYAYAWSLATVEYILSSSGMWGIEPLRAIRRRFII